MIVRTYSVKWEFTWHQTCCQSKASTTFWRKTPLGRESKSKRLTSSKQVWAKPSHQQCSATGSKWLSLCSTSANGIKYRFGFPKSVCTLLSARISTKSWKCSFRVMLLLLRLYRILSCLKECMSKRQSLLSWQQFIFWMSCLNVLILKTPCKHWKEKNVWAPYC